MIACSDWMCSQVVGARAGADLSGHRRNGRMVADGEDDPPRLQHALSQTTVLNTFVPITWEILADKTIDIESKKEQLPFLFYLQFLFVPGP